MECEVDAGTDKILAALVRAWLHTVAEGTRTTIGTVGGVTADVKPRPGRQPAGHYH